MSPLYARLGANKNRRAIGVEGDQLANLYSEWLEEMPADVDLVGVLWSYEPIPVTNEKQWHQHERQLRDRAHELLIDLGQFLRDGNGAI